MLNPPYATVLKPYGRALVDLAKERKNILCLTGDLTRQCEIDLFQDEIPDRFIHAGMAEANMMSMAGALARRGYTPFVHTFGVFATRRPLDQIVNSIAYPNLPVRIVGFMPGISSPGGPSHQAIEDVALMRAIPNMTVIDLADATEITKALPAIVDIDGPVYLRLKRGEIPVLFEETHEFSLSQAQIVRHGSAAAVFGSGMMLSSAVAAADALEEAGVSVTVVNVPVIKPLDRATVARVLAEVPVAVSAENHSIVGGLGSAICEVAAEEGSGTRISRIGLNDTFAEGARVAPPLFKKYGLSSQDIVDRVWTLLGRTDSAPAVAAVETAEGEYAPV
ncbi:MAG TPA: transketolase C-terminal domain-containing protein [Microbacterium sp.]|nr:transketolase C-terminal domain-containing protein [Microbacterium sp.]